MIYLLKVVIAHSYINMYACMHACMEIKIYMLINCQLMQNSVNRSMCLFVLFVCLISIEKDIYVDMQSLIYNARTYVIDDTEWIK